MNTESITTNAELDEGQAVTLIDAKGLEEDVVIEEKTAPLTYRVTEKPKPPLLNRAQRRRLRRYIARKERAQMRVVVRRKPWLAEQAKMRCGRCHLYFIAQAGQRCQCQAQQRHRCMMCSAVLMASQQECAVTNVCAGCGEALRVQWENEEASRAAAYQRADELQRWDTEEISEAEVAALVDEACAEYDEMRRRAC